MSPTANSRIVPQHCAAFTSLESSLQDDIEVFSGERISGQCPAPKAWVSESSPPRTDELPDDDEDEDKPAVAQVHYYRQRQHHLHDQTSPLFSWLSGLLCIPRTSSGRMGRMGPDGRESSVDSVDFVSTWQRAQAEAAARPVAPALKRAPDASTSPASTSPAAPATPESPKREPTPPAPRAASSLRGEFNATCIESRNGRNGLRNSFLAQRNPSICRMLPSPMPSCSLEREDPYLEEVAEEVVAATAAAAAADSSRTMVAQRCSSITRPDAFQDCRASIAVRTDSRSAARTDSRQQDCRVAARTDSRAAGPRPGSRTDSRGGSRPGSKRSVRFN